MKMFSIFIVVALTQVYTLVKIHPTVNLNGCNLLHFNSIVYLKKKKATKWDLDQLGRQFLILANPKAHDLRN